jgi:hypothetical protein
VAAPEIATNATGAHGVAPPRRFGGLLRVRDRVTVHFDVSLDPGDDAVNDIACRLIESANAAIAKEGAYDSHS